MFRLAIKNRACLRQLHQCRTMLKAQAFGMPAMSPTMERGGVVDWKFKAGDTFSAGDVLLEVETDKATIDVEAQDDGKLACQNFEGERCQGYSCRGTHCIHR